jgi:site-specific recombinase XerD
MRPGCLLDSIDTSDVAGHRDKALLATLAYTCSRIGAVVNLMVEDYFQNGKKSVIRLSTKGGGGRVSRQSRAGRDPRRL